MSATIKWGRSHGEGFVESKCGRFKITPNFAGCCKAQDFDLHAKVGEDWRAVSGMCQSQREAKWFAEHWLEKQARTA